MRWVSSMLLNGGAKHKAGKYIRLTLGDGETHESSRLARVCHITRLRLMAVGTISIVCLVLLVYSGVGAWPQSCPRCLDDAESLDIPNHERVTYLKPNGKIRFQHTKRQLPQCLIIGARKAGTRALLTFLDLHPQIITARNEMHFFDVDENYNRGLEWYRKHMPYSFKNQITMEKTPAYFTHPFVAERIWKMNATIKMLLVLRDPVERAVSDYLQIHLNKVENNKPDLSFEEHSIKRNGEVDRNFNPIKRSIYVDFMREWLRWFPRNQFLLLSGENLVKNPMEEIRKVEEFLGLDRGVKDNNIYYNDTRGFYCVRNETREKCLAPSKGRTHPDVNPLVMNKLREFFRPLNQELYELVGQDFGWP